MEQSLYAQTRQLQFHFTYEDLYNNLFAKGKTRTSGTFDCSHQFTPPVDLPDEVCLCRSSIPGAGYGIQATADMPAGAWVGPYEGRLIHPSDINKVRNHSYMWEIFRDGKLYAYIDGSDEKTASWMRFIRCARHPTEQNLYAFQYLGKIYYRAYRNIPRGEELLVWYDEKYTQFLGVPCGEIYDMAAKTPALPSGLAETTDPLVVRQLLLNNVLTPPGSPLEKIPESLPNKDVGFDIDVVSLTPEPSPLKVPIPDSSISSSLFGDEKNKHYDDVKLAVNGDNEKGDATNKDAQQEDNKRSNGFPVLASEHRNGFSRLQSLLEGSNTEFRAKRNLTELFEDSKRKDLGAFGSAFKRVKRSLPSGSKDDIPSSTERVSPLRSLQRSISLPLKGGSVCSRMASRVQRRNSCEDSSSFHISSDIKQDTSEGEESPRYWRCGECKNNFTQRFMLETHVCSQAPNKPYLCGHCSECFATSSDLRAHAVVHQGRKPFKCGYCSRAFSGATTLNNHIRTHTGETPFCCFKCGKAFAQGMQLSKHHKECSVEVEYWRAEDSC